METISLIVMVSVLLEGLVEYAKTIISAVEEGEYRKATIQGVTIVLGILLAFTFHLELFNDALSEVFKTININPNVDMILTGILFSRGSNYFSNFISKLTAKNLPTIEDYEIDTEEDDELLDMLDNDFNETDNTEEAEG